MTKEYQFQPTTTMNDPMGTTANAAQLKDKLSRTAKRDQPSDGGDGDDVKALFPIHFQPLTEVADFKWILNDTFLAVTTAAN